MVNNWGHRVVNRTMSTGYKRQIVRPDPEEPEPCQGDAARCICSRDTQLLSGVNKRQAEPRPGPGRLSSRMDVLRTEMGRPSPVTNGSRCHQEPPPQPLRA